MMVNGQIIKEMEMVKSISNIGIYYFSNGDKYEGEWEDHLQHGKGILFKSP